MKNLLFTMSLILSGCYLANGSPDSHVFWKKIYGIDDGKDWKNCRRKSFDSLTSAQREILNRGEKNWEEVYLNKDSYKFYKDAMGLEEKYFASCLYEFGYRFRPPLYWCLAQDGNNTKICMENMKYRY